MLILNSAMSERTRSKVQEMRQKFEQKDKNNDNKFDKLKTSDKERPLTVLERKHLFQTKVTNQIPSENTCHNTIQGINQNTNQSNSQITSEAAEPFPVTSPPQSNFRRGDSQSVKVCKLRRNVPVTPHQNSRVKQMAASLDKCLEDLSLPGGEPPAKPPRTFEHDFYKSAKLKSKTEDQICGDTILENDKHIIGSVQKVHCNGKSTEKGAALISKVSNRLFGNKEEKSESKHCKRVEPYAVTDFYKDGKGLKSPFKVAPKSPRSTFFTDESKGDLVRCFSDEHVYDEPCISPGSLKSYSSDETLVLTNIIYERITCEEPTSKGLYYSSTPISPNNRKFSLNTARKNANWLKLHKKNLSSSQKLASPSVHELVSQSFSGVHKHGMSDESKLRSHDEDCGDSDNELSEKEVEKRIIYMRTVSRASSVKVLRPHLSDPAVPRLFDCVLVVGLSYNEKSAGYSPYIKLSYPVKFLNADSKNCPALQFCFPDAERWKPGITGETYTFVLTNQLGERTYGYCRRIKPDNSPVSLPIVYCILSPVLSFSFYIKILEELEHRHGMPDAEMLTFFDTMYQSRMPRPGRTLRMPTISSDTKCEVHRPYDITSDKTGVDHLLKMLDITNLVKVYAALLLERRLVLYSSSLSGLSLCVQALQALLYPFVWQHTFIPILPPMAIDVIGSPTPFLVGVLANLRDIPTEDEVLMVDLDNNCLLQETGDELKVIPKKIQKALTVALKMAKSAPESHLVAVEAFMRMFVETVGHFQSYFVTQQDGRKVFEKELFCKAVQSSGITAFLQWFTETQMFNVFIDSYIDGKMPSVGTFERRIQEYKDELENMPQTFRDNIKDFSKKVKTLIGFRTPDKK